MIRVGIAGAGFMGKAHFAAYALMKDDVKVTAFADTRTDKIKEITGDPDCAVFSSIEDMILSHQIDVIDICLPTFLHKKYCLLAAENGIDILCEKPIALSAEDAAEMISAAEKAGVTFSVGHCLRFSREYTILKDFLENGRFGRLRSLRLYRNSTVPPWSENNWLLKNDESGGALLDLHVHDVDMLLFLLGIPESVFTRGSLYNMLTIYDYPDPDIAVSIESSWRAPAKYPFNAGYDAVFETAALVFDIEKGLTVYEGQNDPFKIDTDELYDGQDYKASDCPDSSLFFYYAEIRYFIDCIKKSASPDRLDPRNALEALKIILAEMESLKQKGYSYEKS
ncbi:MAG: Gfo/Idh/MocA family protein [Saccharofermentanales bacterium]